MLADLFLTSFLIINGVSGLLEPILNPVTGILTEEPKFLTNCTNVWPPPKYADPEITLNVAQIIAYYGYPIQEYDVITDDGYILTIQRIPYGKSNYAQGRRPAVMLQHGLLDSSFTFVANPPNQSLGYILADEGFDVWLTNSRGSTYGKRHVNPKISKAAFWDFSWDEIVEHDLMSTIDFILAKTGNTKLFYVGHSQGGGIAFARCSYDTKCASKIEAFFALAPATYLSNLKSPLRLLAPLTVAVEGLTVLIGNNEFNPSPELLNLLTSHVCATSQLALPICTNAFFLIMGFSCQTFNQTRLPVYTSKLPAGTSVKNIIKYGQVVNSGQFQKYDYGVSNFFRYGSFSPPKYDVSQINLPVYVYYGGADWLVDKKDIQILLSKLKTVKSATYIDGYNHVDFVWATDAKDKIYNNMIQVMKASKSK